MRALNFQLVPHKPSVPFLKFRRVAYLFSALALVASAVSFSFLSLNFGIDFRGGMLVEIADPQEQPVPISNVRSAVEALNLGDVQVQRFGPPHQALLRVEAQVSKPDQPPNQANLVAVESLRDALSNYTFRRVEVVGPRVSKELVRAGVYAVLSAMLLVLIYIWLRFEWQFSLGAVAALLHDVLVTIGVFSILQIEFTLSIIAALLTIVGYSLNDTVVVYDRVRENMRKFKTTPLIQVLNSSVNQTLSRTLMTSITTLLALLALFFFGGDVLRGFTFAMIWGVFVGTYSSIFIASPLLLALRVRSSPS